MRRWAWLGMVMLLWCEGLGALEEEGTSLERPAWWGCEEGISEEVLSPWEPLEVKKNWAGIRVDCWSRVYKFKGPFPQEVVSLGEALLSGPCELRARAEGETISWRMKRSEVVEETPSKCLLRFQMEGGGVWLNADVAVELDGLVRVDWTLVPEEPLALESLVFSMPMKQERAEYLYHYPGRWRSHANAGELPEEGYEAGFRPFVWLGDEWRGLSWFCESEKGWFPLDRGDCTRIARRDSSTALELHLVSEPIVLENPLAFTFGFQATPVKETKNDVWRHRICHEGAYGIEEALPGGRSVLDRMRDLGVRTICFHEQWTDIQNHFSPANPEELRDLVEACHAREMRLLLYFGHQMSDADPGWGDYHEECLVEPRRGVYERPPQQTAYMVCYRSAWQDRLAWSVAHVMDEYDVDGVYLDGAANPWACRNARHGCGFERPDGGIGLTYPIFAVRDAMRRVYTIVRSRKGDGLVNVHQSTCMTIPTLAWATSYCDGEQFACIERGEFILDVLPLDVFRTEFMGHPWGVPSEMLCYGEPYTYSEALAVSLLHDCLVRGSLGPSLELESKLWAMSDAFGREKAEWIPYWKSQEVSSVTPDCVKSSLYRGKGSALLVVSNLCRDSQEATVELDHAALGLKGTVRARDALSLERKPWGPGPVQLKLDSLEWRIFWLRSE